MKMLSIFHLSVKKKFASLLVVRKDTVFWANILEFRFVLSQKFSTSNSRRHNIYGVAVSKHYSPTCLDGIQSIWELRHETK